MMGEVLSQERLGSLSREASSMKRILGKVRYDEAKEKVKMCREKACRVIPHYASQMEGVTDAARWIRGVSRGLEIS